MMIPLALSGFSERAFVFDLNANPERAAFQATEK
jgi:hypothetical protein